MKEDSYDLVQALRSTETCRTSANNKDIDVAAGKELAEVGFVCFLEDILEARELDSRIGRSHVCVCSAWWGYALESLQSLEGYMENSNLLD